MPKNNGEHDDAPVKIEGFPCAQILWRTISLSFGWRTNRHAETHPDGIGLGSVDHIFHDRSDRSKHFLAYQSVWELYPDGCLIYVCCAPKTNHPKTMGFFPSNINNFPPAEELGCGSGLPSLCALALGRLRVSKLFVGIENHTEASFWGLEHSSWLAVLETFFYFFHIGNVIIPSDSYFFRGVVFPTSRKHLTCVFSSVSQPARIFPPI